MAQTEVKVGSVDHLDRSITLIFPGGKRVEYIIGDRYHGLHRNIQTWAENGWHNHIVAQVTKAASAIFVEGQHHHKNCLPPWARLGTETTMSEDHKATPNAEYRFTVIAPTAKGLIYNGQRRWFKSKKDALEFCCEVFESEKSNSKSSFDLAIVECVDVVRPKPQVEMISTWSSVAKIE